MGWADCGVEAEPPFRDPDCSCPHAVRNLGRLHGVSMGKGWVRLTDDPSCPLHPPVGRRNWLASADRTLEALGIDPNSL